MKNKLPALDLLTMLIAIALTSIGLVPSFAPDFVKKHP